MNVTIETRYTVIVDGKRHSDWHSRQAADDMVLHQLEECGAESAYVVESYDEVPVMNISQMTVEEMSDRYDEIDRELESIHDELTANGRTTEEAMTVAQAPLVEERRQLEQEFAAMRRADAEAEKVRKAGVAFFA